MPLGRFVVTARRSDVDAFRAATGLPQGAVVPATFPMRWLAAPQVRDALLALVPERDRVPVHESQSFEYMAPLVVDARYTLELDARVDRAPDRLVLVGTISGEDGVPLVHVETMLRLFSTAAVAA